MLEAFPDSHIAEVLLSSEQTIRLIDRLAPENLPSERKRLLDALSRGEPVSPRLRYAPAPDLSELRARLIRVAETLESGDALARLYAERARELEQEAALVEAVGREDFPALACARFDPDSLAPPEDVRALVDEWLAAPVEEHEGECVMTDDEHHPHSLLSILRVRIQASRQPIRVELRAGLSTVAAAGEDVVLIRPRVSLSRQRAERIAIHELQAHVLPRCCARRESIALYRTGCRFSTEHEEGRALLIEERGHFLDGQRRRELALRHTAAGAVRQGATLADTVRLLRDRESSLSAALEMALRALRGGGLAREIVYIPAYLRVRAAFAARPELERAFERGRVSVEAARVLELRRGEPHALATSV